MVGFAGAGAVAAGVAAQLELKGDKKGMREIGLVGGLWENQISLSGYLEEQERTR